MAEPLKNHFGVEIPIKIAGMISPVFSKFDANAFIQEVLDGYEALELMPRGWRIARTLGSYLPDDYQAAIEILLASLGPKLETTENFGMAPFLYLPHVFFVAEHGIEHFEISMDAQYELTQRFSAEFSIRPFIERYPAATMKRLKNWAEDPEAHVRRLVSEGTRPRLPWAPRLRQFQKNPRPVLTLLELLKDDPELFVRRSVANNLNDIGKDHPSILVKTTRKWMKNSSDERRWLIRHALRSAVKRADPGALEVLGFGDDSNLSIANGIITPTPAVIGGAVTMAFDVTNEDSKHRRILVDFRVHFVKANGKTSPKVFKLKTINLAPQETMGMNKKISLAEMTTRKHYPGIHKIDIILNGSTSTLGTFKLTRN